MSTFRRARPSPALVVAILALFVAMGGSAYAGFSVPRNSVGSKQLKKNAVTNKKIAGSAVTGAKIAGSAVTGAKIANGTITGGKIQLSTLGTVPSANTANTATSATHASTADNATNVGGKPIRWVLVDKTGSIVEQSGGFSVTNPLAGEYIVSAGSTVTGHAIVVSDAFADDISFRGVSIAGPCGTGPDGINCAGISPSDNDGTHIFVGTTSAANNSKANHSFYLVLY